MLHRKAPFFFLLLLSAPAAFAGGRNGGAVRGNRTGITEKTRAGKLFSLFTILQFQNGPCTAASAGLTGSCRTENECSDMGGSADGNCAAGFGVCCIVILNTCGSTVTQNCTYIQNPEFPSTSSETRSCAYTFSRICADLCQIRLDFDNLVTTNPTVNTGVCSTAGDTVVVRSPSGHTTGISYPPDNICGTLTGQHMYIDTGTTGNAGTFTLATSIATTGRSFRVKVTYLECSHHLKAPDGCLQYFTGTSGTISSYNHQGGVQLADQNYNLCLRQEEGFCNYQVAESSATTPDPFQLLTTAAAAPANAEITCPLNYISILNNAVKQTAAIEGTPQGQLRCGSALNSIDAETVPGVIIANPTTGGHFDIGYYSGTLAGQASTGFSLFYSQIPC